MESGPKTLEEIFTRLRGMGRVKMRVRDSVSLQDFLICYGQKMSVNLDRFTTQILPLDQPIFFLLSCHEEIDVLTEKTQDQALELLIPNYTVPTNK